MCIRDSATPIRSPTMNTKSSTMLVTDAHARYTSERRELPAAFRMPAVMLDVYKRQVEDPALIVQIESALTVLGSQEEFEKKYPDATRRDPLTLAVGDGNQDVYKRQPQRRLLPRRGKRFRPPDPDP